MVLFFKKFLNLFANKEQENPMKYLIAGLGNMGPDYDDTRHNVGFEVVDALAKEFKVEFKNDQLGDIAQFRHKGRIFVLLKPSTYMNRSGKSVRYWLHKKKVLQTNLLVVVDDIHLPFGKQRLRANGSNAGHNGLKDIDQFLGGNNYVRLRIGLGNDFSQGRQVDHVLGTWTDAEREKLPEIIRFAADTVKSFGTVGIQHTMNRFNKK